MRPTFLREVSASLLAFLLVCTSAAAQSSEGNVWSLQRCLEHALEHNLQLQQAELGLVRGALAETSAKGAFFPTSMPLRATG